MTMMRNEREKERMDRERKGRHKWGETGEKMNEDTTRPRNGRE